MTERVQVGSLQVAEVLFDFMNNEAIPGTGVSTDTFWTDAEAVINDLASKNKALLAKRDELQVKIDSWHQARTGQVYNAAAYETFLGKIGYLLPETEDFQAGTQSVDDKITRMAGPQLVVPVMNVRFVLNVSNVRQGSLYDTLYGTDMISEEGSAEKGKGYNKVCGDKVVAFAHTFLDETAPLESGSHVDATPYSVKNGALVVALKGSNEAALENAGQFLVFRGGAAKLRAVLLKHNDLHFEIQIEPSSLVGQTDAVGIEDVLMETALTAIMDCEDSVAVANVDDGVMIYHNWPDLTKDDLAEEVSRGGSTFTRTMNLDRVYTRADGSKLTLHDHSLLFVRNVGHLTTNDAILNKNDNEVPEGIQDSLFISLIAIHDLNGNANRKNSRTGSVYIVEPEMHGPEEATFTNELFGRVEGVLDPPRNTLKVGIMDKKCHITVSLKVYIEVAKDRMVFINTDFLSRTGDEIHTSVEAGTVAHKGAVKSKKWIGAYENNNVDVGLVTGLQGKAQIGKGMWAVPGLMAAMLEQRAGHPLTDANTAWVPSPTAATLRALHYHEADMFARQARLAKRAPASVDGILTIPLAPNTNWTAEEIKNGVDSSTQGTLGYVVRWVDQGVGCSKVPDINDVGLMEDRATLRVSSRLLTNWLRHGMINQEQVIKNLERMTVVVDRRNASGPSYRPVAPSFDDNVAFQTALELVVEGARQPNGYAEPVLHRRCREFEAKNGL